MAVSGASRSPLSISMAPPRRTVTLESAGGVVQRPGKSGVEIVLCGRRSPRLWALPKGTPEPGETREQTALREASEETGLELALGQLIGSIEYWFVRPEDGARCHKAVYYYLMTATGGDTALHDGEFDEVGWFPLREALALMTYQNEVGVVEKGLAMASS